MSLTTTQPLPRKVTSTRLGLDAVGDVAGTAGHGFGAGLDAGFDDALGVERGVGLGLGELVGAGLLSLLTMTAGVGLNFAAVGVIVPQPTITNAAIPAIARIQSALFMSMQR